MTDDLQKPSELDVVLSKERVTEYKLQKVHKLLHRQLLFFLASEIKSNTALTSEKRLF